MRNDDNYLAVKSPYYNLSYGDNRRYPGITTEDKEWESSTSKDAINAIKNGELNSSMGNTIYHRKESYSNDDSLKKEIVINEAFNAYSFSKGANGINTHLYSHKKKKASNEKYLNASAYNPHCKALAPLTQKEAYRNQLMYLSFYQSRQPPFILNQPFPYQQSNNPNQNCLYSQLQQEAQEKLKNEQLLLKQKQLNEDILNPPIFILSIAIDSSGPPKILTFKRNESLIKSLQSFFSLHRLNEDLFLPILIKIIASMNAVYFIFNSTLAPSSQSLLLQLKQQLRHPRNPQSVSFAY